MRFTYSLITYQRRSNRDDRRATKVPPKMLEASVPALTHLSLDKKETSYDDLLDALRLGLKGFNFE